jgi:DNA polymerase III epsilon subunit-like protein
VIFYLKLRCYLRSFFIISIYSCQKLTKITQAAADEAPPLKTALQELADFVGEKPLLVGHYIGLDIGFLRRKLPQVGLGEFQDRFQLEKSICTWTLAEKIMLG